MPEKENVVKFALVGAQCVGKTTILDLLKKKFCNDLSIVFVEEGARLFFESNPQIIERSADVQAQIQSFVLEREKAVYTPRVKTIVSDRSVIDPVVLAGIWDTHENAVKLHTNITDWLSTYTLFFILSHKGVPSIAEPKRKETQAERIAIHEGLIQYCKINHLPYLEITGNLEQRVKKIETIIFGKYSVG